MLYAHLCCYRACLEVLMEMELARCVCLRADGFLLLSLLESKEGKRRQQNCVPCGKSSFTGPFSSGDMQCPTSSEGKLSLKSLLPLSASAILCAAPTKE